MWLGRRGSLVRIQSPRPLSGDLDRRTLIRVTCSTFAPEAPTLAGGCRLPSPVLSKMEQRDGRRDLLRLLLGAFIVPAAPFARQAARQIPTRPPDRKPDGYHVY